MESNAKDKLKSEINQKNSPQELFVEGIKGFYFYNDIIKFNIVSRPIHLEEHVDSTKIQATLTLTKNNFINMVNYLNNELENIKKNSKIFNPEEKNKPSLNQKNYTDDEKNPPKGNRVI